VFNRVPCGNFSQSVKLAAVGIAGVAGEFLQFAKDGDISVGAQHLLELRQGGDSVSAQELAQGIGGESDGAHNAIVPLK
jgi:hypothetical protein